MKLKITITGPKVHDVGYRPYLTELAMRFALRGFEVSNDEDGGQQVVIALVECDDAKAKKFYNATETKRPQLAVVESVKSEDYAGDVMPLWQFASINTASQINKAIPLLLEIKDSIKTNGDSTLHALREIKEDTSVIKANANATLHILEELKEDVQPRFTTQLRQVQEDIRTIKERLGMS
ncbi:MAG: acylphosphatase [Methanotrichaceae archaeon]|nr:acylphosphatase [Methanotrichaceae archaeon]